MNVIVSALLFPKSKPGQAFFPALYQGHVVISAALMDEVERVLYRPKFDRYLPLEVRDGLTQTLLEEGVLITPSVSINACRDPKDNHVLELAVSGQATCIITGDNDLLALHPFQGIPILSPSAFLNTVDSGAASEPPATDTDA